MSATARGVGRHAGETLLKTSDMLCDMCSAACLGTGVNRGADLHDGGNAQPHLAARAANGASLTCRRLSHMRTRVLREGRQQVRTDRSRAIVSRQKLGKYTARASHLTTRSLANRQALNRNQTFASVQTKPVTASLVSKPTSSINQAPQYIFASRQTNAEQKLVA